MSALDDNKSHAPVSDADCRVNGEESQKLFVKDFIDASLPRQEEFGKAAETRIGNSGGVSDRHYAPLTLLTNEMCQKRRDTLQSAYL